MDDDHDKLSEQLEKKAQRRKKKRRERRSGLWFAVGTFGIVGWSIAIPTLGFLALGIWLDREYPAEISWTITMLTTGITLGCFNAWYWVRQNTDRESS